MIDLFPMHVTGYTILSGFVTHSSLLFYPRSIPFFDHSLHSPIYSLIYPYVRSSTHPIIHFPFTPMLTLFVKYLFIQASIYSILFHSLLSHLSFHPPIHPCFSIYIFRLSITSLGTCSIIYPLSYLYIKTSLLFILYILILFFFFFFFYFLSAYVWFLFFLILSSRSFILRLELVYMSAVC